MSTTKSATFYLVVTIVVVLALLLGFLVFIYLFGGVSGIEFSPDSFERRSFHYYQIPMLQTQVTGINREPVNYAFGSDLVTLNKIANKNLNKERWVLVQQSNSSYRGEVQILMSLLDAADESGQEYWRQWTIDNDKLSDVFWPFVAQAARDDQYTVIPDIFELVHEGSQPDELKSEIEAVLTASYTKTAKYEMEQENYQRASDLLTRAVIYDANNEEAKTRKAECDQHLGY